MILLHVQLCYIQRRNQQVKTFDRMDREEEGAIGADNNYVMMNWRYWTNHREELDENEDLFHILAVIESMKELDKVPFQEAKEVNGSIFS